MEASVSRDELAAATHDWTAIRLRSFPKWDFDEIWNEAYVQAHRILHLWNRNRGNLNTFLRLRLYERVMPQYLRDIGYVPIRKKVNGRYQARSNFLLAESLDGHDVEARSVKQFKMPDQLTPIESRTVSMLMRGLNQKQVAQMDKVSESAIASRLKRMRGRLYD